jgi:ankyrin repeat protein
MEFKFLSSDVLTCLTEKIVEYLDFKAANNFRVALCLKNIRGHFPVVKVVYGKYLTLPEVSDVASIFYRSVLFDVLDYSIYDKCQSNNVEFISFLLKLRIDPNTLLNIAVFSSSESTEILQLLIDHKANINSFNNNNFTPLMIATQRQNYKIMWFLMSKGAFIHYYDEINRKTTTYMPTYYYGDYRLVEVSYDKDGKMNTKDDLDNIALTTASRLGMVEIVKCLVKSGMDVNSRTRNGTIALMAAIECWHAELLVEFLIEMDANFDLQDEKGNTALMIAAANKQSDIVEILVREGADFNHQNKEGDTALMIFIDSHPISTEIMRKLIEMGADLNLQNKEGNTALMKAVDGYISGNIDYNAIEILITEGADVNIVDNDGNTALMIACINIENDEYGCWSSEIIEGLINYHTDVNIENYEGDTVLMSAVKDSNWGTVYTLIKMGLDVNTKTKDGESILNKLLDEDRCLYEYHIKVVKYFIDKGVDINFKNSLGYTPLMQACIQEYSEVVEILLKNGADINATDNDGKSALSWLVEVSTFQPHSYARELETLFNKKLSLYDPSFRQQCDSIADKWNSQTLKTLDLLIESEADVDIIDIQGYTPLMRACQTGHCDILERLLLEDVNMDIRNNEGDTALMIATKMGHCDIVESLLLEDVGIDIDINIKNNEGDTALMIATKRQDYRIINALTRVIRLLSEHY